MDEAQNFNTSSLIRNDYDSSLKRTASLSEASINSKSENFLVQKHINNEDLKEFTTIDLSCDDDQTIFLHSSFFKSKESSSLSNSNHSSPFYNLEKKSKKIKKLVIKSFYPSKNNEKTSFDWNLYYSRNSVLKNLKDEKKFLDLKLIADDNYYEYVHSTVFTILGEKISSYIFSSIKNSSCNDETKSVYLKGISGPVLKVLIDCAYTGHFRTDDKNIVWSVINVAEKYEIKEISDACCTYFIYQLNIDNCITLLHLGIKFKHKLRTAAWNFIRLKFDKIVNECADFTKLSLEELINLIKDDHLNTISDEIIVWQGIYRWVLADLISRSNYLFLLLQYLRFGRLPLSYLEEVILNEPLLIQIENGSLVNNFLNTTKTASKNNESILKSIQNKKIKNINEILIDSKVEKKNGFNILDMSSCVNLIKKMIIIRKNKYNLYKVDNKNLLVDSNPYFVKPRIPAEIIFVIGGWKKNNIITMAVETYDIRTNTWFEFNIPPEHARAYHGVEVLHGLIYLIGGRKKKTTLSTMHCFNPNNGKWYERANMYDKRCYVSTAVLDNFIYAMGGFTGERRLKTVEKYDYRLNQWTKIKSMNAHRSDASAVVYNNKIYIAGGLYEVVQNSVEFYNPIDNTWNLIEPMYHSRNSLCLILYNGYLYALGGTNGTEKLDSVEKYNFKKNSWTRSKPMNQPRTTFKACVLENKLYILGGSTRDSQTKSVEYFDYKTNNWTEVESLKRYRSGFGLCVYKSLTVSNKFSYNFFTNKQSNENKKKNFENDDLKINSLKSISSSYEIRNKNFVFSKTFFDLTAVKLLKNQFNFYSNKRQSSLNNLKDQRISTFLNDNLTTLFRNEIENLKTNRNNFKLNSLVINNSSISLPKEFSKSSTSMPALKFKNINKLNLFQFISNDSDQEL